MTKRNEKMQAAQIKASAQMASTLGLHFHRRAVCVCVFLCVGPDFRERRVYKVKCDLCGAGVPRQAEKRL